MNSIRRTTVALVSAVAFTSLTAVSAPVALAAKPAACSQQQTHVDKATAKLEALTAKFAAHPTKKNQKAKKAQVQRVNHATARLDKCLAAQPS